MRIQFSDKVFGWSVRNLWFYYYYFYSKNEIVIFLELDDVDFYFVINYFLRFVKDIIVFFFKNFVI